MKKKTFIECDHVLTDGDIKFPICAKKVTGCSLSTLSYRGISHLYARLNRPNNVLAITIGSSIAAKKPVQPDSQIMTILMYLNLVFLSSIIELQLDHFSKKLFLVSLIKNLRLVN